MKLPPFRYARPVDLPGALALLGESADALPMAGGQSLLPMLCFRVARPDIVVDIGALPELQAIDTEPDALRIGAGVSHARLEDGAAPGPLGAFLAKAAGGIAFRAIRNRGTIGGSLANADPAADWPVVLASLGARIETMGPGGHRCLSIAELITGHMQTALQPGELITAVVVPQAERRGFGLHKSARKAGEYAEALVSAVLTRDGLALWAGVVAGRPVQLRASVDPAELSPDRAVSGTASYAALLSAVSKVAPDAEPYRVHLTAVAACRAAAQAFEGEVR